MAVRKRKHTPVERSVRLRPGCAVSPTLLEIQEPES